MLVLVVGCGPSAEERYQAASELYETEQKELDRIEQACLAWDDVPSVAGGLAFDIKIAKRDRKPAAEITSLVEWQAKEQAKEDKITTGLRAELDAQKARVEKARVARDAAGKARQ